MHPAFAAPGGSAQPIWFVTAESFAKTIAALDDPARAFVAAAGFEPKAGRHLILPTGGPAGALFALGEASESDPFLPGRLPELLPAGTYRFANAPHDPRLAALAFALRLSL